MKKENYLILPKKLNSSRYSTIAFAALTLIYILAAQIMTIKNGGSFAADLPFLYGPAILMILAGALRSYFFFLLANIYYVVRVAVQAVVLVTWGKPFTSFEFFDFFVLLLLLALASSLAWQVILFYTGHADNVALTHTSLLCTIVCFIFIFFPHIVRLFIADLPVIETWDAMLLSLSFLAFSHGIEKLPAADEEKE